MAASPLLPAKIQGLLPALVAVLIVVAVSAAADLAVAVFPLQFGDIGWRFRFAGLFMATAPQVAMLLVLFLTVGILGGLRGAVRGVAIAALLLGVLYIVLLPVFGLDALQMRRQVPEPSKQRFMYAAAKTGAFSAWFGLMFIWAGVKCMGASKRIDGIDRNDGRDLVVGQG